MDVADFLSTAGGYGVGALLLAVASLFTAATLAVARGMGNWVPAALWLTVPVLALTVGAFGAGEAGQVVAADMASWAPADHRFLAGDAWPDVVAPLVVGRWCGGVALLLTGGAVLIGHLVARFQNERTPERERQWVCARVLLATTLIGGLCCVLAGAALAADLGTWSRTGQLPATLFTPMRLAALAVAGLGAALAFALTVPSWQELTKRRSLVGAGLCLLLLAGVVGAEGVAASERIRLERVLRAPDMADVLPSDPPATPPEAPEGEGS